MAGLHEKPELNSSLASYLEYAKVTRNSDGLPADNQHPLVLFTRTDDRARVAAVAFALHNSTNEQLTVEILGRLFQTSSVNVQVEIQGWIEGLLCAAAALLPYMTDSERLKKLCAPVGGEYPDGE